MRCCLWSLDCEAQLEMVFARSEVLGMAYRDTFSNSVCPSRNRMQLLLLDPADINGSTILTVDLMLLEGSCEVEWNG